MTSRHFHLPCEGQTISSGKLSNRKISVCGRKQLMYTGTVAKATITSSLSKGIGRWDCGKICCNRHYFLYFKQFSVLLVHIRWILNFFLGYGKGLPLMSVKFNRSILITPCLVCFIPTVGCLVDIKHILLCCPKLIISFYLTNNYCSWYK